MILLHPEVKKRVLVIKQFVAIADVSEAASRIALEDAANFCQKCRSLNNFSSLTAIISALGTAPVLRLSRTWAQVHVKTNGVLESMRYLIKTEKNFSN